MDIIIGSDEFGHALEALDLSGKTGDLHSNAVQLTADADTGVVSLVSAAGEFATEVVLRDVATPQRSGTRILYAPTLAAMATHFAGADKVRVFAEDDEQVHLTWEQSTVSLFAIDPENFVAATVPKGGAFGRPVPSNVLTFMVRGVAMAASKDTAKPQMTGVAIERDAKQARMVATDSFRLAMHTFPDAAMLPAECQALLPSKILMRLARWSGSYEDGNVRFRKPNASRLIVEVTANEHMTATFVASLLHCDPWYEYAKMVKQSKAKAAASVTVGTEPMLDAVRLMHTVATARPTDSSPLFLQIEGGDLLMKTSTVDIGVGETRVRASDVDGTTDAPIGFTTGYLLDALKSMDDEEVTISWNPDQATGTNTGAVIHGAADQSSVHLVMPLRGSW